MPGHELPLSRVAAGRVRDWVRDWDSAGLNGRAESTCPAAYLAGDRILSLLPKIQRGPPESDVGVPPMRGCHNATK